MTATSDTTKFLNMLYVDQGARIRNGLSIGTDSVSNPGTWDQYAAFDASGNLTAPNIYSKTDTNSLLSTKQDTIKTTTDLNLRSITASVSISTPNINSNLVAFGNGTTHTILASTVSQFFSLTSFTAGIQVQNGIESGYFSAYQPPTFISTFIASQSGNVYAKRKHNVRRNPNSTYFLQKTEVNSQNNNCFKSGVL